MARFVTNGCHLERVRLFGDVYNRARWKEVRLTEADLALSSFIGAVLTDCQFEESSFELTRMSEAAATGCIWRRCHAVLLVVDRAQLRSCQFEDCMLARTEWDGALVEDTTFVRCVFNEATFVGTVFRHCTFTACTGHGGEPMGPISGATFEDCAFSAS